MESSNANNLERSNGHGIVAMEKKRKQRSAAPEISSSGSDGGDRTTGKDETVSSKDCQLESTQAEMGQVRKENERLRMNLEKMINDYQTLQSQFRDALQKENGMVPPTDVTSDSHQELEANELVSLSLGRTSSMDLKRSKVSQGADSENGLDLGLGDYRLSDGSKRDKSAEVLPIQSHHEKIISSEETTTATEADIVRETWPPQKILRRREENEPVSQPSNGKRARVCLRIRCETPTMNDGCQWRKYGQKIAKGNPCPRAYYRCTVAPACPVRKQVQRCADDMSILIITYEGTHNHPLPVSATGIASTTSAAASMLLSGSSNAMPSSSLNGFNFSISNTNNPNKHIPQQFQFPTSSSSNPNTLHPTVTLDLTSHHSSPPHFNLLSRSSMSYPSRYSSRPTSLNFSSSTPSPLPWANNTSNMFGHGNQQPNNIINSSLYQKNNDNNFHNSRTNSQPISSDTMTAAAITADPSFQSALAAALTNIIGGRDTQLHDMLSGLQSRSAATCTTPPTARVGRSLSLGPFLASTTPKSSSTSPSDSKNEHST